LYANDRQFADARPSEAISAAINQRLPQLLRTVGARLFAAISGMLLTAPARPRQPSPPGPGTRAAMETARMSREMYRL
jgi:hypothetical protein